MSCFLGLSQYYLRQKSAMGNLNHTRDPTGYEKEKLFFQVEASVKGCGHQTTHGSDVTDIHVHDKACGTVHTVRKLQMTSAKSSR